MSLLKLRTATTLFKVHHLSLHKYSRHFQNESFLTLSPVACNKCSFHSISNNRHENLLAVSHIPVLPIVNRRNLSTVNNEPFFESMVKFFAESESAMELEQLVIKFHDITGLHWWSTIVLMTFCARFCVTLPLSIYQQYIFAKVENLQEEMVPIVMQLKREANAAVNKLGMTPEKVQIAYRNSLRKQWMNLVLRDNCHPGKGMIPLCFQIPMWIYLSSALRNIIALYPPEDSAVMIAATEMSVGGPFWCANLLVPDPTFITPVLLGLMNLGILETQILMKYTNNASRFRKVGTYIFRGCIILMVPIAAQMPAAISLYWLSSSTFGLAQTLAFLSPGVRRTFRIPHSPSLIEQPYQVLRTRFVEKMTQRKNWVVGLFGR